MEFGKELVMIVASYAIGCFSTGFYLVQFFTGQDIRQLGSGSTGGTNVGRVLGKTGYGVTISVDILKGAVALWVALHIVELKPWGVALIMPAVVAGHIFPLQLGFHGGKGLATALGAMLVLDYRLAIALIALTILLGRLTKQYTLAVMALTAAAPVAAILMWHTPPESLGIAAASVLVLLAHRKNLLTALRKTYGQT